MIRSTVKPLRRVFLQTFIINRSKNLIKRQSAIKINSFNLCSRNQSSISNTHAIKYGYFTLVDKPIQSATLNSIIELGAQFMYYPFMGWSWPAEASIFIGAITYRLLIELVTKFIQNLKYKNFENRSLYKFVQKVFLVDLNRDIKFYELDDKKKALLFGYYRIGYLIKNGITFYLNLNFMRAAHYILVNDSFNSFHLHTAIFPTLATYDPLFMLPLIPMALTYFWINGSRHPILIHLTRPENLFFRINLAFMAGLIFVPLPTIYSLAYSGLLTGHLIVRKIYHQKHDIIEDLSNIFKTKENISKNILKNTQKLSQNKKSSQKTDELNKK